MTVQEEVERFFAGVKKIIFRPPLTNNYKIEGSALMCLVLDTDVMIEYWYAGINNKIRELIYHGRVMLLFTINKLTDKIAVAIFNKEMMETIKIPNAAFDDSFQKFIQFTRKDDDIFLLIGSAENENDLFNNVTQKNLVLILHGYEISEE